MAEITCRECDKKPTHLMVGVVCINPHLCADHAKEMEGRGIKVITISEYRKRVIKRVLENTDTSSKRAKNIEFKSSGQVDWLK